MFLMVEYVNIFGLEMFKNLENLRFYVNPNEILSNKIMIAYIIEKIFLMVEFVNIIALN